jgi:hypothetical protein
VSYKLQTAGRHVGPFPYYYMIPNTTIYSLSKKFWASGHSMLRVMSLQKTQVLYSVGLFGMPMSVAPEILLDSQTSKISIVKPNRKFIDLLASHKYF